MTWVNGQIVIETHLWLDILSEALLHQYNKYSYYIVRKMKLHLPCLKLMSNLLMLLFTSVENKNHCEFAQLRDMLIK